MNLNYFEFVCILKDLRQLIQNFLIKRIIIKIISLSSSSYISYRLIFKTPNNKSHFKLLYEIIIMINN